MTLWSFTVERGDADPGHPMVLRVSLDPGDAVAELVWIDEAVRGEALVLGSVEDDEVCAHVRTFDTRGEAGPTATACSEPTGCGCTSGSSGARWSAVLAVLLVLLRRRRGLAYAEP
jgi:MYXO-CTERM domain-containing protein